MKRLATVALLLIATLSIGTPARAQWRDGPPIPEPRWIHAAAASPSGDVFAFGGTVLTGPEKIYKHGVGELGLDHYDPESKAWSRASRAIDFTIRSIVERSRKVVVAGTRRQEVVYYEEPESDHLEVPFSFPFGGADRVGRAYWFTRGGPVFFDPRTGGWGQQPGPLLRFNRKSVGDYYEGTSSNWERSAGATAAGADGRIYLVGGVGQHRWDRAQKRRLKSSKRQPVAALEIYDPATDSWFEAALMKIPRQVLAAAVGSDGKLYVFGGCNCIGVAGYVANDPESKHRAQVERDAELYPIALTEVYDPETNTWAERAPLPTPRTNLTAATGRDGKIYVIGGSRHIGSEPLDTVEVYDPSTDQWAAGPSLRIGRVTHASAVTPDGRIWVIGGLTKAPGPAEVARYLTGDRGGPTRSVEILETAPRSE